MLARPRAQAVTLAEDVALLVCWLQHDASWRCGAAPTTSAAVPCMTGSWRNCGCGEPHCPHRIRPWSAVCWRIKRDALLAFAKQLDGDLQALAEESSRFRPRWSKKSATCAGAYRASGRSGWQRRAGVGDFAGGSRYGVVRQAVEELLGQVVRASSVIENLNSRLRELFLSAPPSGREDYLTLLQFFLNHRRFVRGVSTRACVGKKPLRNC